MTNEQSAAFVMAQASAALIEALGMFAANVERDRNGHTIAYDDEAFTALIGRYGIGHNDVCTLFEQVSA